MTEALSIHFPGKLVFGNGVLNQLAEEIKSGSAKHVLLVTIQPLISALDGLFEQLEQENIRVSTDTSIIREPSYNDFYQLLNLYKGQHIDTVLGIGGGSVLDVAKLLSAQLDNEQTLEEIVGIGLLKQRNIRLICAPATAGTGSEVSPNAILVDPEDQKKGIISPFLVPDVVYVDPLLTLSVPADITAATGLDALTHCLEAFTNKFAKPFIDLYAYEGMRLIAANLVQAVKNGKDKEAKEKVAMGSLLGGFCLGPVNTAGVHALSYPLGSIFHLPHGLSNALLLPYVMEYNYPAAPEKYARVALALGCQAKENNEETAVAGIEKIRELISECGIPSRLRDLNIPEDAIPEMAEDAMKIGRLLKNNPRDIFLDDAISIYTAAY